MAAQLLEEIARRAGQPTPAVALAAELTVRKREVLEQVARGRSNEEIAAALALAEYAVKNHLKNILEKRTRGRGFATEVRPGGPPSRISGDGAMVGWTVEACPLRFNPPALAIPPDLQWALVRAFGPTEARWSPPASGREALHLARQFDLAARIGGRHPMDTLAREVGARAASAFALETGMAGRAAVGFGELTTLVASTAAGLGVPVVLLKFAALRAGGFVADGLRVAGDVDVLVPAERARSLAEALGRHGLKPAGFGDQPHHLASLRDAEGRGLDLHVHVPGLHVGRGGFPATCADLVEAGLLRRTGLPGECFLPCLPILVAHAVVHALSHHGYAPHTYPPLRLVGDLLDLGAAADDGELARTALPFVEDEVTSADMAAAVALSRRLGRGEADLFEASSTTSPEGLLLRHLVAGLLDEDYQTAVRLRGLQALGRRAKGPGELVTVLAKHAWRALLLTDAQIDVLYGRPRSRLGYVWRRLARPFDLAGRAARMVAGSLRLRLRR